MSKTDRIKIEEITKDKIADKLLQSEEVYCLFPYFEQDGTYGISKENLLFNSMYENIEIINKEGARFFVAKIYKIESEDNE